MEIETFLKHNKKKLLREYCDYCESLAEAGELEYIETFPQWVEIEYELAKQYDAIGYELDGLEI